MENNVFEDVEEIKSHNSDKNLDFEMVECTSRSMDDNAIEEIDEQIKTNVNAPLEPFIGMEFSSTLEAQLYYNKYAKFKGFGTRKNRQYKSRSNCALIAQEFVCSKEGTRAKKNLKREERAFGPTDETRCGCRAMFLVSKRGEDKWEVTRFVREHNHVMASPRSTKFIRSHRKKTKAQKSLIDMLDESGVCPNKIVSVLITEFGGVDNMNMTERDILNYLSSKRQKHLEKGDAQLMFDYFHQFQLKNSGFYYAIQTDVDGHLANCFWVDARSRLAYKYFGDVVAFDPTYLTNKYKLPFVPFAGVNHHFQTVLFGCALLWDETEETFVWLLKTWLEAMCGVAPKTIITDQDMAMTKAVAKVLPNTVHHFCMWHIEKKIPEVLSHVYHQHNDFKTQFSKCIHQSLTPDEFEESWWMIIETYKLREVEWLKKIYSIREKWVPAFIRQSFCAGMSTTQRSESLNKFFKDYLHSSTPVNKFVIQYEKALDARYNKEREHNFKTINSKPVLKTMYPMEAEAATIYSRKVFRLFQEELVNSQKYVADKIDGDKESKSYRVHEINKEKSGYIVVFKPSSNEAICTCHNFEFIGILCKHVLTVFIKKKILSLPTCYILSRWTKDAKKYSAEEAIDQLIHENHNDSSRLRFNSLMVHSLQLSEKASHSKKHYRHVMRSIEKLCDELDHAEIKSGESDGDKDHNEIFDGSNLEKNYTNSSTHTVSLLDPLHVATKGRPRTLRMKSSLEKSCRSSTCSICKKKGHTKWTCVFRHMRNESNLQLPTNASEFELQREMHFVEHDSHSIWPQQTLQFNVSQNHSQSSFTELMMSTSQVQRAREDNIFSK